MQIILQRVGLLKVALDASVCFFFSGGKLDLKLYGKKEKKIYVNNVAPPKNMLLTQWFFGKKRQGCLEIAASNQPPSQAIN